jgi:hypothetical protein
MSGNAVRSSSLKFSAASRRDLGAESARRSACDDAAQYLGEQVLLRSGQPVEQGRADCARVHRDRLAQHLPAVVIATITPRLP